jgi:alpha-beta hydrolase superfamily lysophospholipase
MERGFWMSVEEVQGHFEMTDGFNLFYRRWKTTEQTKNVFVCIHGGGDHSGWFRFSGSRLAENGSRVYALDLRGFGNSLEEGLPRGDTRDFQRHLQDVDEAICQVERKHPDKEIYAPGFSMGGCYTLWHAANHPDSIVKGFVLVSPGIVVRTLSTRRATVELFFANLFFPRRMYPYRSSLR